MKTDNLVKDEKLVPGFSTEESQEEKRRTAWEAWNKRYGFKDGYDTRYILATCGQGD